MRHCRSGTHLRVRCAQHPEHALRTIREIREAVMILERHPLIGRPAEDGRRELVISQGRSSYLALYRRRPARDLVLVLAIRSAREAGCAAS